MSRSIVEMMVVVALTGCGSAEGVPSHSLDVELYLLGASAPDTAEIVWADGSGGARATAQEHAVLRRSFGTRDTASRFRGAVSVRVDGAEVARPEVAFDDCMVAFRAGNDPTALDGRIVRFQLGADLSPVSIAWTPGHTCVREVRPVGEVAPPGMRRIRYVFPTDTPARFELDGTELFPSRISEWGPDFLYEVDIDVDEASQPSIDLHELVVLRGDTEVGRIPVQLRGLCGDDIRFQRLTLRALDDGTVELDLRSGCSCVLGDGSRVQSSDSC